MGSRELQNVYAIEHAMKYKSHVGIIETINYTAKIKHGYLSNHILTANSNLAKTM